MAAKLSKREAAALGISSGNKHDRHTVDRLMKKAQTELKQWQSKSVPVEHKPRQKTSTKS
ncbi:MAG: hypothetical protein U9Q62_08445 [Campylobacterota bacterium]|nr:hypothetical protein [Campylobacterota bacterium]